jgi:hypothetical protein
MSNKFNYRCVRRSTPRPSAIVEPVVPDENPLGAGSGGDPGDGGHAHYANAIYEIIAPGVEITAMSGQPRVTILATTQVAYPEMEGGGSSGGGLALVNAHADTGMRLTTGATTDTLSLGTNGVEMIVGDAQEINIMRGTTEPAVQTIQMSPGQIVIDGGPGSITLLSKTSISMKVAGGMSSISLTPSGIVLQGLLTKIN